MQFYAIAYSMQAIADWNLLTLNIDGYKPIYPISHAPHDILYQLIINSNCCRLLAFISTCTSPRTLSIVAWSSLPRHIFLSLCRWSVVFMVDHTKKFSPCSRKVFALYFCIILFRSSHFDFYPFCLAEPVFYFRLNLQD